MELKPAIEPVENPLIATLSEVARGVGNIPNLVVAIDPKGESLQVGSEFRISLGEIGAIKDGRMPDFERTIKNEMEVGQPVIDGVAEILKEAYGQPDSLGLDGLTRFALDEFAFAEFIHGNLELEEMFSDHPALLNPLSRKNIPPDMGRLIVIALANRLYRITNEATPSDSPQLKSEALATIFTDTSRKSLDPDKLKLSDNSDQPILETILQSQLLTDVAKAVIEGLPVCLPGGEDRRWFVPSHGGLKSFYNRVDGDVFKSHFLGLPDYLHQMIGAILPENYLDRDTAAKFIAYIFRKYPSPQQDTITGSAVVGPGVQVKPDIIKIVRRKILPLIKGIVKGGRILEIPQDQVPRIKTSQKEDKRPVNTRRAKLLKYIESLHLKDYVVFSLFTLDSDMKFLGPQTIANSPAADVLDDLRYYDKAYDSGEAFPSVYVVET